MLLTKKVDKNLAIEIIAEKTDWDAAFDFIFTIRLRGDHPGLFFVVVIKKLKFEFNYYDIRHGVRV